MLNFVVLLTVITTITVSASISCRNSQGAPVDWFVGYKLPVIEGDRSSISGLAFLYADGRNPAWSAPENIESDQSSVARTLQQFYSSLNDMKTFYMLYNDDHPGNGKTDTYRGHAKGVAVFDSDSGFWLIHSVPNYPPTRKYGYPSSGQRNGQSFMCITFKTTSLTSIGKQMLYIQPSVYLSQLPNEFSSRYPDIQKVIAKKSLSRTTTIFSSIAWMRSQSGVKFTNFAKHKKFDKDLYLDFVAPQLKTSLLTETWLNGPGDLPSNCSTKYKVKNIASVRVGGSVFTSSKDHSKWAISTNKREPTLCIGDINRQKSQSERGGSTMCLEHARLWSLYNNSVIEVQPCGIKGSSKGWLSRLWQLIKGILTKKNS